MTQTWGNGAPHGGPDATQPRVTVRPKPPVLLGAASTVDRWHAPGSCRTTPARAGLGDSREATAAHHGPSQIGASNPLRSRSPCGTRSHPSILPCSILSASLRSAFRLPFGLPSLPPFGARLRFGGLSFPNSGQVALPLNQGQWSFAKSRRSPHLSLAHPQGVATPSPVFPHVTTGVNRTERGARSPWPSWWASRRPLVRSCWAFARCRGHGGDRMSGPSSSASATDEAVTPLASWAERGQHTSSAPCARDAPPHRGVT